MTEKTTRKREPDVTNLATIKRVEAEVVTIKRDLALWLEQTGRPSHNTAITIALLETAFDRYLVDHTDTASQLAGAAADAVDLVQVILRRAAQRRRVALHMNTSRLTPACAIPINDEEWANRLTEMLKLLDTLATRLPKDPSSRQLLENAAAPLGTLLGYFVGGIDQPAVSHKTAQRKAERLRQPPRSALTPAQGTSPPSPDAESPLRPPVPFEVEEWS